MLRHDAERATDTLARADGAAFASVRARVPADYVELPKDYAPFSPFSDGGLLLHSGRFQACAGPCADAAAPFAQSMSVAVPIGAHAIVDGQVVRSARAD